MDALSERSKRMKVKLINYTSDAVNLLLFTKNTRLMDDDNALSKIKTWSEEKKQEELHYMLKTIRSSWEFIDYTFPSHDLQRICKAFHIYSSLRLLGI